MKFHNLNQNGYRVGNDYTVEHVFPHSRYKGNDKILLSCEGCNTVKGNREPFACEVFYLDEANKYVKIRQDQNRFGLAETLKIQKDRQNAKALRARSNQMLLAA